MPAKPKADTQGSGASLNDKQRRFVEEYLIDLNGKQAAIRAGYSERTAEVQASRLLSNDKVAEAVAAGKKARSERTEITQDQVLREYARLGFADIRKAVAWGSVPEINADGERIYPVELKASEDMDDDTAAAVSEVSLTAQGVKIKMYDKKAALDSIARHLGMFIDRTEHTGKDGGPIQTEDVSARDRIVSRLSRLSAAGNSTGDTR